MWLMMVVPVSAKATIDHMDEKIVGRPVAYANRITVGVADREEIDLESHPQPLVESEIFRYHFVEGG
jgi:hypothetical protein